MVDPEIAGGLVGGSVTYLLKKIDAIATRELNLTNNNKKKVQDLGRQLRSIKALLRQADSKNDHDHQFIVWIQEVRDQANAIEDLLDRLSLAEGSVWLSLKMRYSTEDLIQEINTSLQTIQQTRERYHSRPATSIHTGYSTYFPVRAAPLFTDHVDTLGIEEPRKQLVSWALEPKQRREVMFVVGMAGLGKTTLVHSVYQKVKQHFDCDVWITASKSKTKLDILCTLLVEKFGCSITQGADMVALARKLRKFLRNKRYVIVVDDLWVKDVWESIKLVLPDDGNNSRIIVTTRRGDIANSCRDDDSIHIHKLQPLSWENAKQLFHTKAFSKSCGYPSRFEEISKSILHKCDGLPLGIIEIGKLLSSKAQNAYEWEKLHNSLESELRSSGGLSNMMRVLSASYKDLPYHLKFCFLYLSMFPENKPVKRRRLIRLWIAEGFVTEERGKTLEEVGEEYLNELIDRNLMKATEMDFDGRPKSVGVHSFMHKMILPVSHEENFCTVSTGAERNLTKKTRRLSIQKEGFDVSRELPSVRTFFSFSTGMVNFGSFELLKVLDMEGTPLVNFPSAITDLVLLRYLSLRNTNISSIPNSLRNLRHLETLDLKQTLVTKVPKSVLQLEKLHHLLVYRYNMENSLPFDIVQGFKAPKSIGALKNLQKLSFVKASGQHRLSRQHRMIQGLDDLTQLRKLGIVELAKEDGTSLCQSIGKMKNLHSLNVTSLNKGEPLELDAMANPPRLLQRLYLKGPLHSFPKWVSSLHYLVRIRLKWSSLSQDNPIEALQDLPNLMELQLLDAYNGIQLDFNTDKFQKLKILDLEQLKQLRFIIMEHGTLPCLQKLIIRQCNELKQVPVGIDNLNHLNELLLCDMPEKFVAQLRKKVGELRHLVHRISHIRSYQQGQLVEDLS